jgi:hypothetical protein
MTLYHFSKHPFEVGEIVEARQSFPYPDAWAWASDNLEGLDKIAKRQEAMVFIVEPLTDDVEPSPHHTGAYRSRTGFRVIDKVSLEK